MTDKSAPIPLSRIIQRFASFSYNEIEKLLDENSGEEAQKRALMRTLNSIFTLGIRLHVAIKFDITFGSSKDVFMFLHNSSFYYDYLKLFADNLYHHQQFLAANMVNMYDIRGAIDLLIDNCHSRLPRSIFPKPKQLFTQDPKKFYSLLRDILKSKLLTTRVPTHFQVSFNRGRVILRAPNKYKLYLTITSKSGPFVASKIVYLIPGFSSVTEHVLHDYPIYRWYQSQNIFNPLHIRAFLANGYDIFHNFFIKPSTIANTLAKINELLQQYEDSLYEVDDFIQKTIELLHFRRLYVEALRLTLIQPNLIHIQPRGVTGAFGVSFWDGDSFFDIAITTVCKIFLHGKIDIGNAFGLNFSQILGICQRRIALMKLHSLQSHIGGTLNEDLKVPVLHLGIFDIIVESANGRFRVVDNPELDKYLLRTSTYPDFLKTISKMCSEETHSNA